MSAADSSPESRVSLPATENQLPENCSHTGAITPGQILTVSVITRRRNPLDLNALGKRRLTHDEFESSYGALPEDFDSLRAFAHAHGLTVDETASSLARRTLVLRGTATKLEAAFGVKLNTYERTAPAGQFHAYTGTVSVPGSMAPMIESVLGLDTRPIARPHIRIRPGAGAGSAGSFTPLQVAQLYGFPTGVTGAGECIGILELGGGYETSDISTYFKNLGLTPPTVVAVSVDGATNQAGQDPSGADGEVALDIQVAGAIAPGARIAVYFTPNTDQGFIDAITTAVHDTTNKPGVLSISWGGPESGWSSASRTSLDNACQSAAALGVTITVASGDSGSSDGGSGNNVDFPASSPHVLACGGTKLAGSGSKISSEVVWDDQQQGGGATGGGVSTVFALPTWQANANVPKPSGSSGGRGVPDVAADASPESGYQVQVDGSPQVVGGTSAVAPLWAGLLALVNQQRTQAGNSTAGFINPTLYSTPGALRDITSGSNGSFNAGPGWDACTGLGSPNGASVAAALANISTTTGEAGTDGDGKGKGKGKGKKSHKEEKYSKKKKK